MSEPDKLTAEERAQAERMRANGLFPQVLGALDRFAPPPKPEPTVAELPELWLAEADRDYDCEDGEFAIFAQCASALRSALARESKRVVSEAEVERLGRLIHTKFCAYHEGAPAGRAAARAILAELRIAFEGGGQ